MNFNIKNDIKCFLKNLKFKSINLTFSKQLVLSWSLIWFISLFLPWIQDNKNWDVWNSFNSISWNIGYLLIILLFFTLFVSLSTNYKEKLKLYSDLSIKNHFIVITVWAFIISFSVILLSFANWLSLFFENISYWKWVILLMTSWIIILIWWFIIKKEYYSEDSEIILNKFNKDREKNKIEDNMKLPF